MFQFINFLMDLIDVAAGQRAEVNSVVYTIDANECIPTYINICYIPSLDAKGDVR